MAVITTYPFGTDSCGNKINCCKMMNSNGASVTLSPLGASIISLVVPDKNGTMTDVVLGYKNSKDYETGGEYFGATVGRCSGRIAGGSFVLNGVKYSLPVNNGGNHLHGGVNSFSRKLWNTVIDNEDVVFTLVSPDGDEGYPGEMTVKVRYSFDNSNVLTITYNAVSDKDTLCSLTNHSYFNLNGHGSGTLDNHRMVINSARFVEINENLIPTGKLLNVKNTPFDFTVEKEISGVLLQGHQQLKIAKGVDHSFVADKEQGVLCHMASSKGLGSGITLDCFSTQPIIHIYTANFVDVKEGKDDAVYSNYSGFCFETQGYPDAVNHPEFPSSVLKAGEKYVHTTKFAFSVTK